MPKKCVLVGTPARTRRDEALKGDEAASERRQSDSDDDEGRYELNTGPAARRRSLLGSAPRQAA